MKALLVATAAITAALAFAATAEPRVDHRDACHAKHACPSDHHTYLWRGLSCAAKTSPKYNAARDNKIVTHGGRRYYCRKGK